MVANIRIHMRYHKAKKNNVYEECTICGKQVQKYQMQRHIRRVHEKQYQTVNSTNDLKVYCCRDCGEFFSRQQELRQHEYIYHSQDSKIYECSICNQVFRTMKLLKVHRFTHQPLNVKCNICDKTYARKAALYKHNRAHHPELMIPKKITADVT